MFPILTRLFNPRPTAAAQALLDGLARELAADSEVPTARILDTLAVSGATLADLDKLAARYAPSMRHDGPVPMA